MVLWITVVVRAGACAIGAGRVIVAGRPLLRLPPKNDERDGDELEEEEEEELKLDLDPPKLERELLLEDELKLDLDPPNPPLAKAWVKQKSDNANETINNVFFINPPFVAFYNLSCLYLVVNMHCINENQIDPYLNKQDLYVLKPFY